MGKARLKFPYPDAGIKLIMKAVEFPLREIVANCGDEPSVVVNAVLAGTIKYARIWQPCAANDTYGDMLGKHRFNPCFER